MKNLVFIIFALASTFFASKADALGKTYEVNVNHVWANHLDDSTRARSALISTYGVFTNKSGNFIVATFSDGTKQTFYIKDTTTAGVIPAGDAEQPPCENQHIDLAPGDYSMNYINKYLTNVARVSINEQISLKKDIGSLETNCRGEGDGSPLLIDIGNDGFQFSKQGIGVKFDLFDQDVSTHFQWVKEGTNDAFLALDLNENLTIDNGAELFGEGTTIVKNNIKAKHGFEALAQYDSPFLGGNFDGEISRADAIWYKLMLWIDTNSDGVSDESEISKLSESNIKSLSLNFQRKKVVINGNRLPLWSVAKGHSKNYSLVDVYFRQLF